MVIVWMKLVACGVGFVGDVSWILMQDNARQVREGYSLMIQTIDPWKVTNVSHALSIQFPWGCRVQSLKTYSYSRSSFDFEIFLVWLVVKVTHGPSSPLIVMPAQMALRIFYSLLVWKSYFLQFIRDFKNIYAIIELITSQSTWLASIFRIRFFGIRVSSRFNLSSANFGQWKNTCSGSSPTPSQFRHSGEVTNLNLHKHEWYPPCPVRSCTI